MRLKTEPLDLPRLDHEAESETDVDLDADRPRRRAPALAKAIAYARDRCFVSEYPHAERRSWPKKKALRNQTHRRQVDRALRPALGAVTPDIDDFAPAMPRRPRSSSRHLHGNISLGLWVHLKLEKRLSFVGNNIGDKLERARYRRRLVPFFENLVAGRHGHSVELAQAFRRLLDGTRYPRPYELAGRSIGIDLAFENAWCRALNALFAEEAEWETRLRAWIDEVAPAEPPPDEPAWRRIRRLRRAPT